MKIQIMERDKISGFPYEVEKKRGIVKIKFYPKNPAAKYPNSAVIILQLTDEDRKKLTRILG